MQRAHVSKALILNEQKNFIVEEFVHQYLFKGSNFTRRFVVLIMVRRRPVWWPTAKATLAGHEGMVTELQDPYFDGNHLGLSTQIGRVGKVTNLGLGSFLLCSAPRKGRTKMVEVNSKCPKCGEGIMKPQTEHTQLPRTDLLGRARCTKAPFRLRARGAGAPADGARRGGAGAPRGSRASRRGRRG